MAADGATFATTANWYNHPNITNVAVDTNDNLNVPARAVRLVTNTPGTGGTQTPVITVIQAGIMG